MSTRGGRRSGNPGTPYNNRSDLRTSTSMSPTPTPVQGSVAQLAADKAAVPTTPTTPQTPPPIPYAGPEPGAAGPLTRPTEMPDVPVTAGLPSGPGPGPGALSVPPPQVTAWSSGQSLVSMLAANPNATPALKTLAASLGAQF